MKEKEAPERFSLSRWSRRKLEAKTEGATQTALPASAPVAVPPSGAASSSAAVPAAELPSVDSLTFDSDFTAFLRPEVDEMLKRAALKQLFRDPRFNVMDGLDVYIDDYTNADPIPPDMLKDMLQRGLDVYIDDYTNADPIPPDMLKDLLQRGFAAVAPATPSAEAPGSSKGSPEVVPAPDASQPLPATATTQAVSSSEPQSSELPESSPEPKSAPRSPL